VPVYNPFFSTDDSCDDNPKAAVPIPEFVV